MEIPTRLIFFQARTTQEVDMSFWCGFLMMMLVDVIWSNFAGQAVLHAPYVDTARHGWLPIISGSAGSVVAERQSLLASF